MRLVRHPSGRGQRPRARHHVYAQATAYVTKANRARSRQSQLGRWWDLPADTPRRPETALPRRPARRQVIAAFRLADNPRDEDRDMLVEAYG